MALIDAKLAADCMEVPSFEALMPLVAVEALEECVSCRVDELGFARVGAIRAGRLDLKFFRFDFERFPSIVQPGNADRTAKHLVLSLRPGRTHIRAAVFPTTYTADI